MNINVLKGMEERLYEFPVVQEVDGKEVRPGVLGETNFNSNVIQIPSFNYILNATSSWVRNHYKTAIEGLKNYILGHEYYVEWLGRPIDEEEHARHEADYLRKTNDIFGVITHMLRLKYGGEEAEFSRRVLRYYPIGKAFNYLKENYKGVTDMAKQIEEILCLDVQPAFVKAYR